MELGLFMGACMFVAYRWGRFVERKAIQIVMSALFHKMDEDMGGAVVQWFTNHIKQHGDITNVIRREER